MVSSMLAYRQGIQSIYYKHPKHASKYEQTPKMGLVWYRAADTKDGFELISVMPAIGIRCQANEEPERKRKKEIQFLKSTPWTPKSAQITSRNFKRSVRVS